MKRVAIYRNGCGDYDSDYYDDTATIPADGKLIAIPDTYTLEDVMQTASSKLHIQAERIYTQEGGLIDDVNLIRDNDLLYFTEGESYREPKRKTSKAKVSPVKQNEQPLRDNFYGDWIKLNVGGKLFTTTRHTLVAKEPDSMLARMFDNSGAQKWSSRKDETGAYLIDRSAVYFEPILNYLRHNQLIIDKNINPEGVLEEARFYGISSLIEQLELLIESQRPAEDNTPITRREFILSLMSTPSNCELRCQGLNFQSSNLTKLDLRYVNFKHATLKMVNFTGANLSYCNFERADLSRATLDGANLLGAKLLCANLENASMKGCNFEDPAGSRANMEGANLKSVNLEGSHMAAVNLRVATLKNANLQNCDLRAAVLAGADLENCDLSGCDLQEANLRGANLKGATFELMLNPLHMSQTIR